MTRSDQSHGTGQAEIDEFLANPFGDHSPGLQRLLFSLRDRPAVGKLVLVEVEPGRKWQLARLGRRGRAIERLDQFFDDLREAERHIFLVRLGRIAEPT